MSFATVFISYDDLAVQLALSSSDSLAGLSIRDGITPVSGDLILTTAQSNGTQNGVYVASLGPWKRVISLAPGQEFRVLQGNFGAGKIYVLQTQNFSFDSHGNSNSSLSFQEKTGGENTGFLELAGSLTQSFSPGTYYLGPTSTTDYWYASSITTINGLFLFMDSNTPAHTYTFHIMFGPPFSPPSTFTGTLVGEDAVISSSSTYINKTFSTPATIPAGNLIKLRLIVS